MGDSKSRSLKDIVRSVLRPIENKGGTNVNTATLLSQVDPPTLPKKKAKK